MEQPFMTKEAYRKYLQDNWTEGSPPFSDSEEFYVEVHYLNYWNKMFKNEPAKKGIGVEVYIDSDSKSPYVYITCNNPDVDQLIIAYRPDADYPDQHGLEIDRDISQVYEREPGQNPRTEWVANEMANDWKMGGKIVFKGDPYQ